MKKEDADKLSLQELCDYAVEKIVEQGGRCYQSSLGCQYSDNAGNHCAIGWLLDHEDYELMKNLDGEIIDLIRSGKIKYKLPKIFYKHISAFSDLQTFHDKPSLRSLSGLSEHIDTNKSQYKKWLEINSIK